MNVDRETIEKLDRKLEQAQAELRELERLLGDAEFGLGDEPEPGEQDGTETYEELTTTFWAYAEHFMQVCEWADRPYDMTSVIDGVGRSIGNARKELRARFPQHALAKVSKPSPALALYARVHGLAGKGVER
jgi:hypothetical protein